MKQTEDCVCVCVFFGRLMAVIFPSLVEAPAPDSAVNHGGLFRIGHSHPTHKNTERHMRSKQGIPFSLKSDCLMCLTVLPLVSIAAIIESILTYLVSEKQTDEKTGQSCMLCLP